MGRNAIYQKDGYIIIYNYNKKKPYYTVVNLNLNNKPHTHVRSMRDAKLIIHWCRKNRIPGRCTSYIKKSISRIRPDLLEQGDE